MDKRVPTNRMLSPYRKAIINKWSDKFEEGEIYEIRRREKIGLTKSYDGGYFYGREMEFVDFIGYNKDILLFKDIKNGVKETVMMVELEMVNSRGELANSVQIKKVS